MRLDFSTSFTGHGRQYCSNVCKQIDIQYSALKIGIGETVMLLNRLACVRAFASHTIFSKSSGNSSSTHPKFLLIKFSFLGSGKCGIAVIRVSGDKTRNALKALTGFDSFKPRFATLKQIRDPSTATLIDNGLVLFFNSPKSFTGEDSCEFQVHGGPAVVTAILNALSKVDGLRPAEPGEFTRRAFFNGKMDLTEVEGLADLIHAETEQQRKQALIQADGHLSKLYNKWRTQLIRCIAHIEAYIDFSEDENIEDHVLETMQRELEKLRSEIQEHLIDGRKGERLRDGVKMVILGEANVGKSSLMNLLVQRDVSIVTNVEGTTRDVIESHYDINGYPVLIADTAGLRESRDVVEAEGISRARKYATKADLVILLIDAAKLDKHFSDSEIDSVAYQKSYLHQLGLPAEQLDENKILRIVNKIDLLSDKRIRELELSNWLGISCTQSINIAGVVEEITARLKTLCGEPSAETPVLSHVRHRHHLQECLKCIDEFTENFDPAREQDFAILVHNLRTAVRSVGKITGEVRVDDVLDVIFRDFCIGK